MGYNITIGRKVRESYTGEDGKRHFYYDVEGAEHPDAPTPPGDEGTGKSNSRAPSYGAWHEFAAVTGLRDLLVGPEGITRNMQCVTITYAHLDAVKAARTRWLGKHHKPPGYADDGSLDPFLMRLDWLVFWMHWALDTWDDEAAIST